MRNFWLDRRRQKKIDTIAKLLTSAFKQKFGIIDIYGVKKKWQQQKKDTKTQQ